jgi:hypothetical protein
MLWRRGWDSNPRLSFPNTRFPSVLLKPLGHLSAARGFKRLANSLKSGKRRSACVPKFILKRAYDAAALVVCNHVVRE